MSIELGPHGIRTNNVNPTVVMTKMGAKAWSDPAKSNPILSRIPLGRFAGRLKIAQSSYHAKFLFFRAAETIFGS